MLEEEPWLEEQVDLERNQWRWYDEDVRRH